MSREVLVIHGIISMWCVVPPGVCGVRILSSGVRSVWGLGVRHPIGRGGGGQVDPWLRPPGRTRRAGRARNRGPEDRPLMRLRAAAQSRRAYEAATAGRGSGRGAEKISIERFSSLYIFKCVGFENWFAGSRGRRVATWAGPCIPR